MVSRDGRLVQPARRTCLKAADNATLSGYLCWIRLRSNGTMGDTRVSGYQNGASNVTRTVVIFLEVYNKDLVNGGGGDKQGRKSEIKLKVYQP